MNDAEIVVAACTNRLAFLMLHKKEIKLLTFMLDSEGIMPYIYIHQQGETPQLRR